MSPHQVQGITYSVFALIVIIGIAVLWYLMRLGVKESSGGSTKIKFGSLEIETPNAILGHFGIMCGLFLALLTFVQVQSAQAEQQAKKAMVAYEGKIVGGSVNKEDVRIFVKATILKVQDSPGQTIEGLVNPQRVIFELNAPGYKAVVQRVPVEKWQSGKIELGKVDFGNLQVNKPDSDIPPNAPDTRGIPEGTTDLLPRSN